jgi:hypothetical protein
MANTRVYENMKLRMHLSIHVCMYIYYLLSSNTDHQNRNVEGPSKNIDLATHTPKIHNVVYDDHVRHSMVIRIRSYSDYHRMHPMIIIDGIAHLLTSIIVTTDASPIMLVGCIVICM